jgi:hypothetical protein
LYLKGDELQPDVLTGILGVDATKGHEKGDRRRLPSGSEVIEKSGMWKLVRHGDASDVSSMVEDLLRYVHEAGRTVGDLPGVEFGFVDVLVMRSTDGDGGGSCELRLTAAVAGSLAKVGLAMEVTFAVVKP